MKKNLYKLFGRCIVSSVGVLSLLSVVNAAAGAGAAGTDPAATPTAWNDQNTTTYALNVPGADALKGDTLLLSIKTFINWTLGLLGMITLVVLLYGGFQMITAAGDETKYKTGFKVLKQAGFGLLFIGLAWLIISLIFWIVNQFGSTSAATGI